MEWGRDARKLTQDQLQELEFRLEVVALAAQVGVDEAARVVAQRWPERQISPDTITAWVQDYDQAHALSLGSLKVASEGGN